MKRLWFVIAAFLLFINPGATRANGISVSVARYSERAPVGSFACCSAFANLTITYSGSDRLVVGIKDISTGRYLEGRVLFNYPYADINATNCQVFNSSPEMFCDIVTVQDSGDLHLGFSFTAPNRTGNWDLEAVAMLEDSNLNPIDSTLSISRFTIRVYDVANVFVDAPQPVGLKLDGMSAGPGSFQVSLRLGSNHTF